MNIHKIPQVIVQMQIKSFPEKKKSQDISKGKQTTILIDNRVLILKVIKQEYLQDSMN